MKVFHVSWNALETVFHEMLWKETFSVSLPSYKFPEFWYDDVIKNSEQYFKNNLSSMV